MKHAGSVRSTALWPALYATLLLLAAAHTLSHPHYNWDVIEYVAATLAPDYDSDEALASATWSTLRDALPADAFAALTQDGGYRSDIYGSPLHLRLQLPFYRLRPGYIALLRVLYCGGIDVVRATRYVSVAAWLLVCALIWRWLGAVPAIADRAPSLRFAFAALLSLSPPVSQVAALLTPDALSALLLLGGAYLVFARRKLHAGLAVLLLSIFVRSDNVVVCAAVAVGLLLAGEARKRTLVAFAGIALLLEIALGRLAGAYGWSTLIQHTFIAPLPAPDQPHARIPPVQLLKIFLSGSASIRDSYFVVALLLFAAALGRYAGTSTQPRAVSFRRLVTDTRALPAFVFLGSVVLHALCFPVFWDRFFVAQYLVAEVTALSLLLS